jgi:hypothetical protein
MLLSLSVVFIRTGTRDVQAPHVNIAFAGIAAWGWTGAKMPDRISRSVRNVA